MRFGLVHRIMTDTLAALGVIALILSGQFSHPMAIGLCISLTIAIFLRDVSQKYITAKHLDTTLVVFAIAFESFRFLTGLGALDTLIEFAVLLQIVRLFTRRGAAHDQQIIVLALLHLIAGTVLGGGIGYGLAFLGVLVIAPGALALSHLRREVEGNYRQGARDRTGLPVDVPRILRSKRVVGRSFLVTTCLLSIPMFLFTGILFVLFPRVGLSLLLFNRSHAGRMIGFSGRVDLGQVGVLRSDPALALRIQVPGLGDNPPERLSFHLRGTALDQYDGRTWSQSESFKFPIDTSFGIFPLERNALSDTQTLLIDLEPIDPPVIFLPQNASAIRVRSRMQTDSNAGIVYRGPEGELRYQSSDDRGLRYEVFLSARHLPTYTQLPTTERNRYLQLPSNLPERIRDLARSWTFGAVSAQEKATAIELHLRTEYRYDLGSPSGRDSQPLDHFLFESKRGHCEFYSTALAILLRSVGIPTRNVTGFIGGTYNRFGKFYAVRQGDAHSWAEVYLDNIGWATYDPTPPSDAAPRSRSSGTAAYLRDLLEAISERWDRHVVGYDLGQQISLYEAMRSRANQGNASSQWVHIKRFAPPILIGIILAGGFFILYRRHRKHLSHPPKPNEGIAVASSLYEMLDKALLEQGLPRPTAVPPLKHAQSIAATGHPLSEDILFLTRVYLQARFGGLSLTSTSRHEFETRVRKIRATKPQVPLTDDAPLVS